MTVTVPVQALRRAERLMVAGGLAAAAALAWGYTVWMSQAMGAAGHLTAMSTGRFAAWSMRDFAMAAAMWAVMMAAMMLPTIIPVTLTFAAVNRGRGEGPFLAVGAFVAAYLAVWSVFSAGAALAQWGLHAAALLSPATLATGPALAGALLIAAGAFQWTPWKDACMVHCRSPMGFFLAHWRPGRAGAFRMGLRYGAYCVGCCWMLMALSFGLGLMNLAWMGVLTAFMLVEKAAPAGGWVTRAAGVGLIMWGAAMLAAAA